MLFKNFFKVFPDERGFLNPFDMDQLFRTLEIPNFNIRYQLISFSEEKNVFRGFHYQKKPFQQTKVLIILACWQREIIGLKIGLKELL